MNRKRKGFAALAGGAILAAGFAWGVLAQREKIFPHSLLRRVGVKLGARVWKAPASRATFVPAFGGASLPYLSGQVDPHPSADGIVVNMKDRVAPGDNLFSMPGRPTSYLLDPAGKVVWRWSIAGAANGTDQIGFTHLYPNGDALALVERRALLKIDRNSRVLWRFEDRVHHDAWVGFDGRIYTLVRRRVFDAAVDPSSPVATDSIMILSPDGQAQSEIPLLEVFESSPYRYLLPRRPPGERALPVDVLHTNHLEVYDGKLERLSPLFRRGNLLVSFRNICSIAILDGQTHAILWLWGPMNLALQHHATILANGDVLLFNNGLRRSQVVEIDPRTDAVVWRYDPEDDAFFSSIRGSCQRLSNGDTLIAVSQAGYGVEVTRSGEVVWKFINPDIDRSHFRQGIFRINRVDPASLTFLPSAAGR
ncbi:MAG: arylsulfotransferase family protein [Thermoanaerobaculia bacterium]